MTRLNVVSYISHIKDGQSEKKKTSFNDKQENEVKTSKKKVY